MLLTHHDPDRTDDALDLMASEVVDFARQELSGDAMLAYEGMRLEVHAGGYKKLVDRWDQRT